MKAHRLVLCFVLLSGLVAARADGSLASIFTNADMAGAPERRPSIILIQFHGLGYGDLSCYGQTNYQTPNLDRLATEGIRFTNFHPGGTNFHDALATLMSGKNTASNGAPALASQLQAAGYRTCLIGEWTLDPRPWADGFDEFGGFLNPDEGRNYFANSIYRFDRRNTYDPVTHAWTDVQPGGAHNGGPEELHDNSGGRHGQFLPELFINMMCNFIRISDPDQYNRYRPFLLVADLPAPRSASPATDEFPVPSDAPYTDQTWPQAAKDRASLITRLDGGIGRLVTQLHDLGLSNNVALFITSSEAPEPFKDSKLNFLGVNGGATNDAAGGAAPLPMIVWFPQEIPAGQVSNFKWTGVDFLPTVLKMAYVKPPKDVGGMSIVPVLQGKKGPEVNVPEPMR